LRRDFLEICVEGLLLLLRGRALLRARRVYADGVDQAVHADSARELGDASENGK
jgi:hypothetical protein